MDPSEYQDTRENLNAMVLKHEQQIKDLASQLLKLKRLITPTVKNSLTVAHKQAHGIGEKK